MKKATEIFVMMNAVWERFSFCVRPSSTRKSATEELSRADAENGGTGDCKVTEAVWKSAIYLGPGGPLVRDR
jgi:hypothetical protein